MKKILPLIFLLSALSLPYSLHADDLKDFKDKVEQEEEQNRQKDSQDSEDTDDQNQEDDSRESHHFLEFLWQFTFMLWYIHNETAYYAPYPYEKEALFEGMNFIGHDMGSTEEVASAEPYRKNYNFGFYGLASIDEDFNTIGGMFRISGKAFNHLGPELDYRLLWDGSDFLHILGAGGNISFFQFDYLSLDFYVAGAFFMGLMERQGVKFGAKLTSYPFRPLSLEVRSGVIFFESIKFAEVEAKLGFHLGRSEIFGDFYTLQSHTVSIYAFGIGVGVHF